jgi:hypothetical protein
VLADTLGGIQPDPFYQFPARLPADIIADAQRTLVVRDGVASFFYNPSDDISYLQDTVNGLKGLGYTFAALGSPRWTNCRTSCRAAPGHGDMNRRGVLIGFANGLAAVAASDASANCNRSWLSGTFIQPTNDQAVWSSSDWRRLFGEFETLAITNVFLQWTVLDRTAFFPTSRYMPSRAAILPVVLNLAAREGMHVWIGLHLDTHYWEEIKQDPDRIRSYFRERLRDLTLLLADLDRSIAEPPFAAGMSPTKLTIRLGRMAPSVTF